jgi:hypothetical protein
MSTTLIHQTGEVIVSETSEEAEAALRVEQAAWEAEVPLNEWKRQLKEADATMPRPVEDVISTMSDTQKAALPSYARDAYAAKVTLRGEKP